LSGLDRVNINAVVKQHCCDAVSEDRVRVSEFMRDLVACRDWYMRGMVHTCALRKVKYVTLSIIWLLYSWFAVTVYLSVLLAFVFFQVRLFYAVVMDAL